VGDTGEEEEGDKGEEGWFGRHPFGLYWQILS